MLQLECPAITKHALSLSSDSYSILLSPSRATGNTPVSTKLSTIQHSQLSHPVAYTPDMSEKTSPIGGGAGLKNNKIPVVSNNERIRKALNLKINTNVNPDFTLNSPIYLGSGATYNSGQINLLHRSVKSLWTSINSPIDVTGFPKTKEGAEARREYNINQLQSSGRWGCHDYLQMHMDDNCCCKWAKSSSNEATSPPPPPPGTPMADKFAKLAAEWAQIEAQRFGKRSQRSSPVNSSIKAETESQLHEPTSTASGNHQQTSRVSANDVGSPEHSSLRSLSYSPVDIDAALLEMGFTMSASPGQTSKVSANEVSSQKHSSGGSLEQSFTESEIDALLHKLMYGAKPDNEATSTMSENNEQASGVSANDEEPSDISSPVRSLDNSPENSPFEAEIDALLYELMFGVKRDDEEAPPLGADHEQTSRVSANDVESREAGSPEDSPDAEDGMPDSTVAESAGKSSKVEVSISSASTNRATSRVPSSSEPGRSSDPPSPEGEGNSGRSPLPQDEDNTRHSFPKNEGNRRLSPPKCKAIACCLTSDDIENDPRYFMAVVYNLLWLVGAYAILLLLHTALECPGDYDEEMCRRNRID